jgi:hypothetical protein
VPSAEYLRKKAEHYHQLANESKDPEAAERWRALARDLAASADELEERAPPALPVSRGLVQQQEIQQQQKNKAEDEK